MRETLFATFGQVEHLLYHCVGIKVSKMVAPIFTQQLMALETFVPNLTEVWDKVTENLTSIRLVSSDIAEDTVINETFIFNATTCKEILIVRYVMYEGTTTKCTQIQNH